MIHIINLGESLGDLASGVFLRRGSVRLLLLHFGRWLLLLLGTCEEETIFVIIQGFSLLIVKFVLVIASFLFVLGK